MSRRERSGALVLPGAPLVSAAASRSGDEEKPELQRGVRDDATTNQIRATVLGLVQGDASSPATVRVEVLPRSNQEQSAAAQPASTNEKSEQQQQQQHAVKNLLLAPKPGSVVLFRVTRIQSVGAGGPIVAIDGRWCAPTFRGFVRLEDIRTSTAKAVAAGLVPTHAAESFRLGDLVCANVLSLTESRHFQLTTQPPHCGLVKLYSERPTDGAYSRVPNPNALASSATSSSSSSLFLRDQVSVECEDGSTKILSRWIPSVIEQS